MRRPASATPPPEPPAVSPPHAPEPPQVPAQPTPASPPVPAQPAVVTPPSVPDIGPWPPYPPMIRQLPPAPPGLFQTRWPGPADGAGPALLLAVQAGALGFATFVPLTSTGIGWVLGGLVAATGVAVAARASHHQPNRIERLIRAGWGAAALALLSVLAFRNAWWLVTFCVLGALGCAALAVAGGRSIRSILISPFAVAIASLRGLPWLARALGSLRRAEMSAARTFRIGVSLLLTVVVLIIFGALLVSADAVFAEFLSQMTPTMDGGRAFIWVFLFGCGGLATAAGAYLVAAPPDLSGMDAPSKTRVGRIEWGMPVGALVVLFLAFVVVQLTVLFGGSRHVLTTAGLDYAEYARSGFWQLMWVTVLTLAALAAVGRWAARATPADRLVLRVLLGALSTLSLVIVASALYRMYTYQQAYSFTGERVFVMAFELLLGAVFLMIMAAGVTLNGGWIPRGALALTVLMLLALAVLNPERYTTDRNVARYNETGKIDLWYLRALSADATPALATLPDELRRCTLMWIAQDLKGGDPWYAWNWGRQRARAELDRLGPGAVGNCSNADLYDFPGTR